MKATAMSALLAATVLLSACNHPVSDDSVDSAGNDSINESFHGNIQFRDQLIVLHVDNSPEATIDANGQLRIAQQDVSEDANQRTLLQTYYKTTRQVVSDGEATGKAGDAAGDKIANAVQQKLADGHPDQIKDAVVASVQPIKQAALAICQDVGDLAQIQAKLADALPSFKPYAHIVHEHEAEHCRRDIH